MRTLEEDTSSRWRVEGHIDKGDGIDTEHGKRDRTSPREACTEGTIRAEHTQ